MMMQGEEGVVIRGRVEIDTRQPFRSVKEAVVLFGEKILAGEIYANKLKEMQNNARNVQKPFKFGAVTAELEETKQSLQKAKEEGNLMANCLNSLKQELEHTKRELHHLKSKSDRTTPRLDNIDEPDEIHEELKFVENTTKVDQAIIESPVKGVEFEKKRSVKFASPPFLTKVIISKDDCKEEEGLTMSSKKTKTKTKKKPLIPLIGGLFLKKKGRKDGES